MNRALRWMLIAGALAVVLPHAAWGQTGACRVILSFEAEACVDGVTEDDCALLATDQIDFEWVAGGLCEDFPTEWDGACDATSDIGDICVLVDPGGSGFDGFEVCEAIEGSYRGDGTTCQPVPTLPGTGRAILALVLLVGALLLLTRRQAARSG